MGLSHLVATGDETSPDPIAVARKALSGSQGRSRAGPLPTEHPSPAKTAPKQQKRHPGYLPAGPGLLVQSDLRMEPPVGFEPTTFSLRGKCSTPELRRRTIYDLYGAYTIANISRDYRAGRI